MAERTTIARPYAEAVYQLAQDSDSTARWGDVLSFYAIALGDDNLQYALSDPRLKSDRKLELLASLLEDISGQESALLKMLLENGKIKLLPEISMLYQARRAEAEGSIEAQVVSAFELQPAQVDMLAAAIKQELKRDVTIVASVDPSIIGGVIIRAGDTVIDASVTGKLKHLTSYLTR
jgi:F-type H+-transporting ATPase subunit delta